VEVYFDCNATTPLDTRVFEAMEPFMRAEFGNPSSIHSFGQRARRAIEKARERVASLFNVRNDGIVFTCGGTEAINLLIKGIARKAASSPAGMAPRAG